MSKEVIEGAKGRTDLSRIIGETLPLRRQGGEWVALCPFHGERTPSFTIYPDHFHCYGCGVHGDAIDWLKRAHGMSFFEAVAYLAGDGSGSIIEHREPRRRHTAATLENQEKARRIWSPRYFLYCSENNSPRLTKRTKVGGACLTCVA